MRKRQGEWTESSLFKLPVAVGDTVQYNQTVHISASQSITGADPLQLCHTTSSPEIKFKGKCKSKKTVKLT